MQLCHIHSMQSKDKGQERQCLKDFLLSKICANTFQIIFITSTPSLDTPVCSFTEFGEMRFRTSPIFQNLSSLNSWATSVASYTGLSLVHHHHHHYEKLYHCPYFYQWCHYFLGNVHTIPVMYWQYCLHCKWKIWILLAGKFLKCNWMFSMDLIASWLISVM